MGALNPSDLAYTAAVVAAAGVALAERRVASLNERRRRAEGALEIAPWVYAAMLPVYLLHFVMAPAERVLLVRRPAFWFSAAMFGLYLGAKILKLLVIRALGWSWTMRAYPPERGAIVTGGPYRFLRHPNYVAVLLEVTALPLMGGAWATAAVCGGAFVFLLAARVRTEERALFADPVYAEAMSGRPRFLPAGRL
ncbi:MAG TPA: isoprenylcysteine carboxylmethyltransferase family protein [Candidatus Polarisedimenticolia bacterium]|nr:isoprenylcysteine carboxylmethyltransferase family protein [Candidatus Polarisedimenticolia bacterium]